MNRVFLNVDAGELATEPEALYEAAHAVSIACGGHAGDAASMMRVLEACARFGTNAGAHPSYEDRDRFGRRAIAIAPELLEAQVRAQCAALAEIAAKVGVKVAHVKAHGALYHAANADAAVAHAVVRGAITALGRAIAVLGPARGEMHRACDAAGVTLLREGFADRAMRSDGTLVPRTEPGAVLHDVNAVRARAKALGTSGSVDTVCVHGDSPGSLALARAVREVLDGAE